MGMKRTASFFMMVLGVFLFAAARLMPSPPTSSAPLLAYSFRVFVPGGYGSSTVIGNARYHIDGKPVTFSLLLTCAHVVKGAKWVKVDRKHRLYPATVLAVDPKIDLALLEVKEHWKPAALYFGPVAQGEAERIVGAPIDYPVMVSGGFIGPVLKKWHGRMLRQGSAPSYPGNSGSGVFVRHDGWKMAGVLDAVGTYEQDGLAETFAPTVSLFVPMQAVRRFLNENGYS